MNSLSKNSNVRSSRTFPDYIQIYAASSSAVYAERFEVRLDVLVIGMIMTMNMSSEGDVNTVDKGMHIRSLVWMHKFQSILLSPFTESMLDVKYYTIL